MVSPEHFMYSSGKQNKTKPKLLRNAKKQADPHLLLGKLLSIAQRLTKRSFLVKSRIPCFHDMLVLPILKLIIWVKVLFPGVIP